MWGALMVCPYPMGRGVSYAAHSRYVPVGICLQWETPRGPPPLPPAARPPACPPTRPPARSSTSPRMCNYSIF